MEDMRSFFVVGFAAASLSPASAALVAYFPLDGPEGATVSEIVPTIDDPNHGVTTGVPNNNAATWDEALSEEVIIGLANGEPVIPGTGGGGDLEVSSLFYDPVADSVTLTWRADTGLSYRVLASPDLSDWSRRIAQGIDVEADENPADGGFFTITIDLDGAGFPGAEKLFFSGGGRMIFFGAGPLEASEPLKIMKKRAGILRFGMVALGIGSVFGELRVGHAQSPAEAREEMLVFGPENPYPADAVKANTPLPRVDP